LTYDTTGPTTINERTSFVYFLILLSFIGTAAWLTLELHALSSKPAPILATAASQPATRPAGELVEGVNRISDDSILVKAGDTVISIYWNDTTVWPSRTFSRDNPDAAERWRFANIVNNIARDPQFAERYDAANVAEKLRAINLRPPRLNPSEYSTIRTLFLAMQDAPAGSPDRIKAEQALYEAAASMPVPSDEQHAFDDAVAQARALLTPQQLELIRTGGKREPPPRPATRPTSRPATRPAGRSAATSLPATQPTR
jgi:hypothetical protein